LLSHPYPPSAQVVPHERAARDLHCVEESDEPRGVAGDAHVLRARAVAAPVAEQVDRGRVFLEIGIQQVERDPAEANAPDDRQHGSVAERHGDDARLAIRRGGGVDRRIVPVQPLVALFLPAFAGQTLVKVTLRIHEPDTDERYAEVRRLLAVIAGEHAETAGVDRQRLVQCELGREVGDRLAGGLRKPGRPPRVVRCPRGIESGHRLVIETHEFRVGRSSLEPSGRDHRQHPHRIVRCPPPERVIESPEHHARFAVPAPPQIGGQLVEPGDTHGQRWKL
jgi:hypothetical protein